MKIFLDSGAFSVWNKGEKINLDDYIEFIKKYEKDIDLIASLDVIPGRPNQKASLRDADAAAQEGFRNYEKMLAAGIPTEKLLHTFHQGDPDIYLEKLVKLGGYIGVSPANDRTSEQRMNWMDNVCIPQILDGNGQPKVKFHGFAVTSPRLIFQYPWTSVDSNSWRLRGGGYALIDLPINLREQTKKEHCYIRSIPIGDGLQKYNAGTEHPDLFSIERLSQCDVTLRNPTFKRQIEELLAQYGFTLEALKNDHHLRASWNAIYLMSVVKRFSTCNLYLASSVLMSVRVLRGAMRRNNISMDDLNVLVSFAALRRKKPTLVPSNLDLLIKIKNTI